MSTSLNFVAIAAVSLLLLAAAQVASAARTTVIIHAIPVPENWMWSEARLWHCQEYMMEEAVRGGGAEDNGSVEGLSRREIDLKMCCHKLRQMEEAAEGGTCSGVEEAMRRLVADQKQRGDVIMGVEELNNAWDVA
ncbi:hypothetical protein LINPERHAP2_LOCUS6780, partial [Linum perenne]